MTQNRKQLVLYPDFNCLYKMCSIADLFDTNIKNLMLMKPFFSFFLEWIDCMNHYKLSASYKESVAAIF